MIYKSMMECVLDLERNGHLVRVKEEVDPNLEMAEIHRRIFEKKGPAILFENVKGSPFPAVSNIYGTYERADFIFRDTLPKVQKVMEIKADPSQLLKNPLRYLSAPFTALTALPWQQKLFSAPSMYRETKISLLPQVVSWPDDGGAFVTLPQVYTEDPDKPGIMGSNIGMYRIQLSGNDYIQDKEIGLHYQIHRGIGVHHEKYNKNNQEFRCSIFVGGPPSHAFAAIMPLPEGLPEPLFAGMLGGRRFRYKRHNGHVISSDADFVITGKIVKNKKMPEGPFGDHLGYYSLKHDFPYMEVDKVYHRKDAVWHFTCVGRPPAEDSSFGYLIHKIVEKLSPQEFPGLVDIHAVDAAGVHPLLLAIGKERYMPFREKKPEEILTIANRILGSGQTSLAKFLFIAAEDGLLNTHDLPHYFQHVLERVDWMRDLHFQTRTTIDTLDYSGSGWNEGSKVVFACCGDKKRSLTSTLPDAFQLPEGFGNPVFVQPGILAIKGPAFADYDKGYDAVKILSTHLERFEMTEIPLIVLCDDSAFMSRNLNNFIWATFTRANPSHDIHGVRSQIVHKHWGCSGPLIIDSRIKPHHAPELIADPKVSKKVDTYFSKNGSLAKWG
ncbi:MAG: UbiD family decarboxylase [Saprospiraceae bacterium]